MTVDLFRFWSTLKVDELRFGSGQFAHPTDQWVLSRVKHGFDLSCWPGCFSGRLKEAPIVLLYLSPGLSKRDRINARNRARREMYADREFGRRPLSDRDHHAEAWKWWRDRTRVFEPDWEIARNAFAILNIGAYHSKSVPDPSVLAALPSSRVSLGWAQQVLFPRAIAGDRIVICLRAARFWGVHAGKTGAQYGKGLFAPAVTRGGHMVKSSLREEIIAAVRKKLQDHAGKQQRSV
jgi:hypothetical protein